MRNRTLLRSVVGAVITAVRCATPLLLSFLARWCLRSFAINRDDFVAVDHGINSIGPMLHQLGARSDQGERSNLVIDCLDTLLIEVGKAQLDHIAIPQLVVVPVDLLVAESRKGASEAMDTMSAVS
jgi:hypothetical protein